MNNVYTNITDPRPHYYNGEYITNYDGKFNVISSDAASGLNALDLNGLDFVNTWHFDSNGGYPSPVKTEDVATVSQSALNLKAVNLTYATDGTFDINFYYEPVAELADIITTKVCVGVADGSALYEAQGAVLSDADCETLGLNEGALCYTIGNIPARKIGDLMLPTVVAKNVGTTIWGATKQLSVADYAKAVISGEGIYYPEATTDTEIEQDKKIAAAVINYGAASVEALAAENANEPTKKIAYMDGNIHTEGYFTETDASFLEGHEGSEEDPYIISTPKQLYHIVKGMNENNTADRYFKVDPSVDVFVLQTKSYMDANGGLDAFMKLDAQGVKDFFDTNTTGRGRWMANSNFKGNIDFSGVRIVGMYTSSFGMINMLHIGASLSDATMSHCYNISGDYSGTIAGRLHNPGGDTATPGTVTFDKIALYNNYQENTGNNGYARTGVLFGASTGKTAVKWSNLLVYDNVAKGRKSETDATMMDCALVGSYTRTWSGLNTDTPTGDYSNSIILGCYPYPIQEVANHGTRKEYWKGNVYTDMDVILTGAENGKPEYRVNYWDTIPEGKIIKVKAADLKGDNAKTVCSELAWNDIWFTGTQNSYPFISVDGVKADNSDGQKVVYMESAIHTEGYFTETDASFLEGHEGSEEDPYIISTPKQLYHIVKGMNENNTADRYFKVDPSVDVFVLQTKSYMDANGGLDAFMKLDAQGVKDFFDTNTTGRGRWMANSNFKGNIDFSGVRIVGMYTSSFGMINMLHIGASLSDATMSHCYNISGDYSGTIAGRLHNPGGDTATPGTVTFDKIALYNNYQENTGNNGYARTGVLFGASTGKTAVKWSNLLVYDNVAKGRKSETDATMMDCALVGSYTRTWSGLNTDTPTGDYSNSIILGCYPYPIQEVANHGTRKEYWKGNVYTDMDVILTGAENGKPEYRVNYWDTIPEGKIIKVNAADLKGENAKDIVLALNNADEVENDVWYVDAWGGYPSFTPSGVMPNQYQSEYDGITVNGNISYGGNNQFGVYRTTVGLKTKPYVAFTFAFGSENGINYRKERAKITVKVVGANGNTYYNGNVPAYEAYSEGNYIDLVNTANGCTWINRAENVRYHLLKLENINVQDLTDEITVTISYGEKVVTSQFSLGGFAKNYSINYTNTGSNYYLARANAVKALIYYSDALKARYGA